MTLRDTTDQLPPEGMSVPEASKASGIGRTKLYEALASGALPARRLGRRVIILRSELVTFLAGLPSFKGGKDAA